MLKICFICHGNICRSPMAEYLFKDMVNKSGIADKVYIESMATSAEALNEPADSRTAKLLNEHGISCSEHISRQFQKSDYDRFDLIIVMDSNNERNLLRIIDNDCENKVHKLLEYINIDDDIADPWYTHDFNKTWGEISKGLEGLLKYVQTNI